MAREVIESGNIVIKTEDGASVRVEGKCDATRVMLLAFKCLPQPRRELLLSGMQAAHEKLLAEEPRNG